MSKRIVEWRRGAWSVVLTGLIVVAGAQPSGAQGRGGPPPTPQAGAPVDLAGTWVSIVTEDWRWRMMTPPKGDYASVPLNAEGRRIADSWDLERDNTNGEACRPFGAANIMRVPARVRFSWNNETTLRLETDAGQQTRVFQFEPTGEPIGETTWQGHSVAEWDQVAQENGFGFGPPPGNTGGMTGHLKVVTTNMRPGYLRWNGVPYSEDAILTEHFNQHTDPVSGEEWFTVVAIVDDPTYLTVPFIVSSSFKREMDESRWNPTPCATDPPAIG
jgi:hypothetical protein